MKRTIPIWAGTAGLYCAIAAVTILFASQSNGITTVWPANGILVAMLLARTAPRWRTVLSAGFAGNIVAGLLCGVPILPAFLYGVINMVEVCVAASLLRRMLGQRAILESPAAVGRFILVAGIIAPSLSAIGGALVAQHLFGHAFLPSYRIWAWSDGLGLLIVTPLSLALVNGDWKRVLRSQRWSERIELAGLLLLTLLVSAYIFSTPFPLLFGLFPMVILVTFRAGRLGAKMAVVLVAATGAIATGAGYGPIAALNPDPVVQAYLLQGVLAVLLLTCLPVAATLSAQRDLTDALAERERILAREAATDGLTGFLNRAAFREQARAALASPGAFPICLVAIDLDHFKGVNDRWGHHTGDRALAHMARTVRAQLRGGDIIGRTGGDEFMLLLPGADLAEAERICARMRDSLRRAPLPIDEGSVALLSISCGIASAQPDMPFDTIAKGADRALYRAKSEGRNLVRIAS
ncbi:MAG: diguanylate cyclase [Sphingobium sp.]